MDISPIGYIKTDFPEKFGIPRQSGMIDNIGKIFFYPKFRNPDAFKGMEGFSHLWLLWNFDIPKKEYTATVKPPRLGGNTPMGVFATRSPFRPNPIGLSSVKLQGIEYTENGPIITVSGADLRDNTLIYDIKPYLRYTDSHPDAVDGWAGSHISHRLAVNFPDKLLGVLPTEKQQSALAMLALDPRPSYQSDPERIYGTAFAGFDIHYKVADGLLTVIDVTDYNISGHL